MVELLKKIGLVFFATAAISIVASGCQKIPYKPYLPEEMRAPSGEPTQPGAFTGKKRGWVIY